MGRGGERFGAGRPGKSAKANHCRSIDVRRLQRDDLLQDGVRVVWAWKNAETGATVASIGFRALDSILQLDFVTDGTPVAQRLPLTMTRCNFGGERVWFRCPCCSGRVAVVYLRWRRFACRRCNRIAYPSQSADACGRSWIKQSRAETKLGPNRRRPKGMRHATYRRLWATIMECETSRDEWIERHALRLFPGLWGA
jgi:hypothetical protein